MNSGPGGTFGVNLVSGAVDLAKLPVLSFDYAVPPDVKINLYALLGDRLYEVLFTGDPEGAPLAQVIGAVPGVTADGQWHHAEVDLAALVRSATGAWTANSLVAQELWIGNLSERDYLLAGNGANAAGTAWSIDNLRLYSPQPQFAVPPPTPPAGRKIDAIAWSVDAQPAADPQREKAQPPSELTVQAEKSGWQFVHAAVKLDDGSWTPTVHLPLPIDADPPRAEMVQPKPGGTAGEGEIILRLDDPSPGRVDWGSVKLKVNGAELTAASAGVTVVPERNEMVIDVGKAGMEFRDGQAVTMELVAAKDYAGHSASGQTSWSFTYDRSQDKRPPLVTAIEPGLPYLVDADFENGLPALESYSGSGGALLFLDRTTAASGQASLRLVNPSESGHFGVRLTTKPFDAGVYRLVSFDYRIPRHYRGDFAVYVNGDWKAIKFTDTDCPLGYIGQIEGVKADGRWHHAEFNLYDMLVKDDPTAPNYVVRWFVLADWGAAQYNFRRREIWLDNIQVIPVVSGMQPITVKVAAADSSGIAGVAWLLDQVSLAAAPQEIKAKATEFQVQPAGEGLWWLHLRVADNAGNFSPCVARRILVDSQPPMASIIEPTPGASAAQSTISMALLDRGIAGIDPASVVLEVDGAKYDCSNPGLTYDAAKQQLTWNCEQVQPRPVVFSDGHEVKVKLVQAKDYAGNPVAELPEWSWKMDYRLDHKPPAIASVDSPTHKTFRTDTFEDGVLPWSQYGASGARVELDTSAADGQGCVKLTQVTQGGTMAALVCSDTFYAEAYPIIAFDYNFQPGVQLDLMLQCNGNWFAISMTDNPAGAIGRIPGMTADGKWHHASVDIFPLLRRQIRSDSLAVTAVVVTDRNSMDNPVGAVARFDNFVIGRIGEGAVKLAWRATDATGIKGYSYVVDRSGGTVPDAQAETSEQSLTLSDLAPGVWYFHVRAQDGAGNWGPPSHYAILNRSAG
ncbi:MAG: fibronectin type III domain-containing protein [Armatimonadetes bacterium]|nr:fibronectin type III domain-containing protein [Armatimonadota bacterium]